MITRMLSTYLISFSVGHSLNMMARNPFSAVGLGKIVVAIVGNAGSASSEEAVSAQNICFLEFSSVLNVNKIIRIKESS